MADLTIGGLTPTAAVVLTDKVPKEPTAGPPAEYFLISQLKSFLDTIYAPITGGAYVLKAGDTMTGLLTIAQATANTSNLILSGQSLTGANAQSLLSMTGTWNTSGNPVALRLAITDTASGATSKLLEILAGAAGTTSRFSVDSQGNFTPAGFMLISADSPPSVPSSGFGYFSDTATWYFRGAGVSGLAINAGSGYFGIASTGFIAFSSTGNGDGSADVMLSRTAAGVVQSHNGTPGTYRDLQCRTLFSNNAASLVSTNTTLTNFAAAGLGTLGNAPTAGNPAKWIAIVDDGTTRYIPTWT